MGLAKALFALFAISGIASSYPINYSQDTSTGTYTLASSSLHPRYKNPFDVGRFLRELDYKIPNNKDIQEWVKEARKKGAFAAEGKLPDSGDDDDDEEGKGEENGGHAGDLDDDDIHDGHSDKSASRASDDDRADHHHHHHHRLDSEKKDKDKELESQMSTPASTPVATSAGIPLSEETNTIPTSSPSSKGENKNGITNDVQIPESADSKDSSTDTTRPTGTVVGNGDNDTVAGNTSQGQNIDVPASTKSENTVKMAGSDENQAQPSFTPSTSPLSGIKQLLDAFTPKDKSEASY